MTWVDPEDVRDVEVRLGRPRVLQVREAIDRFEADIVRSSQRKGRAHDVTLFIRREDGDLAVIRKPFFPPGAWRAPSGGLHPGEGLEEGARREALEETGLQIEFRRYLVRLEAVFDPPDGKPIPWTSHVIAARMTGGILQPKDTVEIAGARWLSPAELVGPVREVLLRTGRGLFRYRVRLHDEAVARLDGGGDGSPGNGPD